MAKNRSSEFRSRRHRPYENDNSESHNKHTSKYEHFCVARDSLCMKSRCMKAVANGIETVHFSGQQVVRRPYPECEFVAFVAEAIMQSVSDLQRMIDEESGRSVIVGIFAHYPVPTRAEPCYRGKQVNDGAQAENGSWE